MTAPARRSSLLAVSALVCLAFILALATQAQSASSLSTCHLTGADKGANKYGPSYLQKLKVKGVSCAAGKSFVRAYYKCRTNGSKPSDGKCTSKVNGYSCSETRSAKNATGYNGTVSCKNGSKQVYHVYRQLFT